MKTKSSKLYTLTCWLTEGQVTEEFVKANPVVSRTIEIRGDQTLDQLHREIFKAFDRWEEHMCQFEFGDGPRDPSGDHYIMGFDASASMGGKPAAGTIEKTRMDDLGLEVGRHFGYWFDFGDDWYHELEVTAIGESDGKQRYPRITARVGESPPQYPDMEDEDDSDDEE
jgi:hypothetical protein